MWSLNLVTEYLPSIANQLLLGHEDRILLSVTLFFFMTLLIWAVRSWKHVSKPTECSACGFSPLAQQSSKALLNRHDAFLLWKLLGVILSFYTLVRTIHYFL